MSYILFTVIDGGITAPQGFSAASVNCGIKAEAPDLVLIYSDRLASAAATITTNSLRAAPTFVTQEHTADGRAQAVVANSWVANAATGAQGMTNAWEMGRLAAQALGVAEEDVVVCSTGHIGEQLPMDNIAAGIAQAGPQLSRDNPELVARGIMTTDTYPKMVSVEFEVGGTTVKMGAIAKGAGMICPNMATMLCFITTDLAIDPKVLQFSLREAVRRSFNCISVDGCMSTNDTVAILANGAAGNTPLTSVQVEGYDTGSDTVIIVNRFDWDEIDRLYDRPEQIEDSNIDTIARAEQRGDAYLRQAEIESVSGMITIPVNCGQQLFDVIDITDARAGLDAAKKRVLGLVLVYNPYRGEYRQRLWLGAV